MIFDVSNIVEFFSIKFSIYFLFIKVKKSPKATEEIT